MKEINEYNFFKIRNEGIDEFKSNIIVFFKTHKNEDSIQIIAANKQIQYLIDKYMNVLKSV